MFAFSIFSGPYTRFAFTRAISSVSEINVTTHGHDVSMVDIGDIAYRTIPWIGKRRTVWKDNSSVKNFMHEKYDFSLLYIYMGEVSVWCVPGFQKINVLWYFCNLSKTIVLPPVWERAAYSAYHLWYCCLLGCVCPSFPLVFGWFLGCGSAGAWGVFFPF